jgi:hypothetical protein
MPLMAAEESHHGSIYLKSSEGGFIQLYRVIFA